MITISFNIRCANDPDGNSIKERAERLKAVLDKYNADIIGFQEATPEWLDIIKKDYGEKYEIFNRYRDSANLESTPILWKKERRISSLTAGTIGNVREFVFGQGFLISRTEKFLIILIHIMALGTTAS